MPSGPGIIPETKIHEIASTIPPFISSVLLTSRTKIDEIIEQHHRCRTNAIQIVDRIEHGQYTELRRSLPGVDIIQVIHVHGVESINEAMRLAPYVDGTLLDSGNQDLNIKDWEE